MSNITKNLTKQKEQAIEKVDTDSAVKTVKLLEASSSQEDIRIANALGGNHNIARAQNELGKKLELEKLDGKYAGNVFTLEQIKNLAKKYNMRFLTSNNYCGNLDLEVIQKLKTFSKETSTEISDGNLRYNFFILAPENCFKLHKIVKVKRDPDPAIFYKIDENHYRLIHQWGTDFNVWNRIQGIRNQSEEVRWLFHTCVFFVGLALFMIGMHYFFDVTLRWGWYFLTIFALLFFGWEANSENSRDSSDYHDAKWRSESKLVKK